MTHHDLKLVLWAHYLAEEYFENNYSSLLDQYIKGEIYIDLVVNYEESDKIGFEQPINNSSHIVANIKIMKVLDDFSALCEINEIPDLIKVEFERKVNLKNR